MCVEANTYHDSKWSNSALKDATPSLHLSFFPIILQLNLLLSHKQCHKQCSITPCGGHSISF